MVAKVDSSLRVAVADNFSAGNLINPIENLIEDISPQLGGDLDVNGKSIISINNGDIAITPDGTGIVNIDGLKWPDSPSSSQGHVLQIGATASQLALQAPEIIWDLSPQLGGNLDTNAFNILFDNGKGILDDSSNEQLLFTKVSSAINYINISNNSIGNNPIIAAVGDDSNLSLNISAKGTGDVRVTVGGLRVVSDNEVVSVGVGNDLSLNHDGTDSTLTNSTGTFTIISNGGDLQLRAVAGSNITLQDDVDNTKEISFDLSPLKPFQDHKWAFDDFADTFAGVFEKQSVSNKVFENCLLNQTQLYLPEIRTLGGSYRIIPSQIPNDINLHLPLLTSSDEILCKRHIIEDTVDTVIALGDKVVFGDISDRDLLKQNTVQGIIDLALSEGTVSVNTGTITRSQIASTGDVGYTGIGFQPTGIIFFVSVNDRDQASWGFDNGSLGLAMIDFNFNAAATWTGDATHSIDPRENLTIHQKGVIKQFDSDGFTITWTKTGTPSAGTLQVRYMAFR